MNWAADMHPGRGAKAVLMCLADHASDHSGEDWTCFPSIERIMDWTDDSRSSVERYLKRLEADGYISRRRRRRADGRLGIYDFVLHRSEATRARLKAERAGAAAQVEVAGPEVEAGSPHVNLTCGPHVNLTDATRQNDGQPYVSLTGLEPSGEPLEEPSHRGRAREPGDHGFDELAELWPESGCKRTHWGKARAAWAKACDLETADRLLAAGEACARDPDVARGDFGWPGLHTWLSEERWRAWLPKPPADAGGAGPPPFDGPPELAQRLEAIADVAVCLRGARWDAAGRTIVTATSWGRDELARRLGRRALLELEINIERAADAGRAGNP